MLIIRGVNVFPSQVESVILELPEFEAHYLIVVDRMNNTDTFQIQVEVRQEYYSDEMNKMIGLEKEDRRPHAERDRFATGHQDRGAA